MSGLQERVRQDSSSDDDTGSYDDDGIYDNRKSWEYKALALRQIIGGTPGNMFPKNLPTLYAFSWHRYVQICKNSMVKTKESNFYQAKE